jgi:hypothetical protein
MSVETFKVILGETSLTDEQLEIMLERAKRKAINHYFWREDDNPTDEEIENFIDRYEYEIYDLAKTVISVASRNGLKQFSELGVTRVWESGGDKEVEDALSAIPVQTYVW